LNLILANILRTSSSLERRIFFLAVMSKSTDICLKNSMLVFLTPSARIISPEGFRKVSKSLRIG